MNDDELTESERAKLDAWTPLAPPSGFADRVLAAREVPARRRWPLVAGGVAVIVAAAALLLLRPPSHAAHGELTATTRTTAALGDRAVAVAEAQATLAWRIDDDGDAVIDQREGDVFYRVDRGGPFVVHTPAGDVRVTGTCFRIEVQPMNRTKQMLLSGTVGAVLATAVVVTVYEGHVIADSKTGTHTEIAAGNRATLRSDGRTIVAALEKEAPQLVPLDEKTATREQLVTRTKILDQEITKLRTRIAELETAPKIGHNEGEPGRAWHDASPELLKAWVAECHVRADFPNLDHWQPETFDPKNDRGIEQNELPAVNAATAELQKEWKALVKALYIEATGDVAGAETLSIDAMRNEIEEKGAPEEHNTLLQRIAQERAGMIAPPTPEQLAKASPYERMFRASIALGDKMEAALAKRLGPERASAIRGDGWSSRSDWSGCPRSE